MTSDCTTIYLVRHAHADWEPDENRPLSKRGREDAKAVGHILEQFPIDAIYASPYRRAYETVEPLAHALGLEIKIEPDLRERALGRIQPEMFVAAVKKTWDDPMFSHPGGETNLAAQKRGLAVLNRVRRTPGQSQIVLSTHGVMMTLLLQSFDSSLGFAFWASLSMPDIYAVEFCNGGRIQIRRIWHGSAKSAKLGYTGTVVQL